MAEQEKKREGKYAENDEWNETHYDRITYRVKLGEKENIKKIAKKNGMSLNKFIDWAVNEKINEINKMSKKNK